MILNGTTKKAQKFYKNYEESRTYDIYEAYDRPSWQKVRAFENIKKDMAADEGWGLKITGWNSCSFSAAYKRIHYGTEQLLYYTISEIYIIDIDDEMLLMAEVAD